jgi:acid phosphatase
MIVRFARLFCAASAEALLAACATGPSDAELTKIDTIVVIYAENRSFDNLYGLFPGANGIANAKPEQTMQRDHDGTPLPYLTVWGSDGKPDPRFPRLPNGPFRIDAPPINKSWTEVLPSPIHAFYHNQEQINGGRNDMFAAMSTVGGWTMGYFDGSKMRLWQRAKDYTLADNFSWAPMAGRS